MSLQTFTHAKSYIDVIKVVALSIILLFSVSAGAEWKVDFSRRATESRTPASAETPEGGHIGGGFIQQIQNALVSSAPSQELVILNTSRGFLPSSISVKEGIQYRVHVVNVNKDAKNVSFVMDAFSEHHATYYGKIKTFHIQPKRTGVYTFVSPETSAQGRIVVHPAPNSNSTIENRFPASE